MVSEAVREITGFIAQAKNPQVRALLTNCLRELEGTPLKNEQQPAKPPQASKFYTNITQYAWDQSSQNIKIYFTIPVLNDTPISEVELQATSRSVDFRAFNGQHFFKLSINPLLKEVNENMCSYKLKPSGAVVLTIPKALPETWSDLKEKASQANMKAPSFDKDADPQAGLMKMMKDMYNEGDDDMKRTIAKAWSEGQGKRGAEAMDF
ncbi:hypothetical protein XU18_4533 [Perkinsela sp. CCAP 1560/4]|nr:hypothetical protein XU18_5010 [Perkinsela sp. CCAP 1560/4]KNH04179.1 hypothetical protein XU18_4533 [Perkinsela sp. CCAP 1560/4]|eukprot:KNH03606.1 hypothetical protein XU18_5010 [Perkinsela sp. CCAP 1560/4]